MNPPDPWSLIGPLYILCAIAVGIALLVKTPPGVLNLPRLLINVIFWPLLVFGKLL